MSLEIIAEDFPLTEALKTEVENQVAKLEEILPEDSKVSVFLSEDGPKLFVAKFQTHAYRQDFFAQDKEHSMYEAIKKAGHQIFHQVRGHLDKLQRSHRHS